ncbi:T9SS type A sorting domain-containing protein [Vicingaceae bacterium]|nr:T9SS type A sorting domain-containing protein [Vicingaceae bacterium]
MKKYLLISTILLSIFTFDLSAQNQYFSEFSVPSLKTNEDSQGLINLLTELGAYSIRADKNSQKVLFLSDERISEFNISTKLIETDFSLVNFNSGIQGVGKHKNFKIPSSNKIDIAKNSGSIVENNFKASPCSGVSLIVNTSCVNQTFDNTSVGSSTLPSPGCANYVGNDLWFSSIVSATGGVKIKTSSGTMFDSGMAIYTSNTNDCSDLLEIACSGTGNGSMTTINISLPPGTEFWIRVWGEFDEQGTFDICLTELAPAVTASDCSEAVDICSDPTFTIEPNGTGLVNDVPASGSLGNPNSSPTSANLGCLLAGETNSTWMIVTIEGAGNLEFTFGAGGSQSGYYDWIMWPYNNDCSVIAGGTIAPITCNWNAADSGGTGAVSVLPAGGYSGNYEPSIPVSCGDKFIICFSNFSSTTTSVPINFGGTASVSCSPFPFEMEATYSVLNGDSIIYEGLDTNFISFTRNDTSVSLTVYYTIGGIAINGADYALVEDSVVFAVGQDSLFRSFEVLEDGIVEPIENVTISFNQNYCAAGINSEIKFYISDTATVVTSIGKSVKIGDSEILLYPNPSSGIFHIERSIFLGKEIHIKMLDGLSRVILDEIINATDKRKKIDISKYSKGMYYLHLTIDEEIFVKQILKN